MTNKELQAIIAESDNAVNNVVLCGLLNTEVQNNAKKDKERPTAYDSLNGLYNEYTKAKKAYDEAINYCLWQDEEFATHANAAIEFAIAAVSHSRGFSKFGEWVNINGKTKDITPDVYSLAGLTSFVAQLVKDYEESKKQVDNQKKERKSLQERLAAARAALAKIEAEAAQAGNE